MGHGWTRRSIAATKRYSPQSHGDTEKNKVKGKTGAHGGGGGHGDAGSRGFGVLVASVRENRRSGMAAAKMKRPELLENLCSARRFRTLVVRMDTDAGRRIMDGASRSLAGPLPHGRGSVTAPGRCRRRLAMRWRRSLRSRIRFCDWHCGPLRRDFRGGEDGQTALLHLPSGRHRR